MTATKCLLKVFNDSDEVYVSYSADKW